MAGANIRKIKTEDVDQVLLLMRELAEYERLDHLFVNTAELMLRSFFGPEPGPSCFVAEVEGALCGYAVYFRTYSTFTRLPGIWLEDIYVQPDLRGSGIGKELLREVAAVAVSAGYPRLDWAVLEWNTPAIEFYQRIGARLMEDWKTCRLEEEGLRNFAAQS